MITKKVTAQTYEELADFPKTVYKYRNWEAPFESTVLTKREVFFSSPKGFTDPLDCKNPIRYDLLTDKEIYDFYYSKLLQNSTLNRNIRKIKAKELARNSPLKNKAEVTKYNEETFNLFCEIIGVLSLTANHLNVKMWAGYSKNHTGFCVGFDTKRMNDFFGGVGPVIYKDRLPIIYPSPRQSLDDQQVMQIFYKEDKWAFEEEFRAFKVSPYPMTIQDRTIQLPPDVYKEVILGAKITEKTKRNLLESLPEELKHLPIKQAIIISNEIVVKNYSY